MSDKFISAILTLRNQEEYWNYSTGDQKRQKRSQVGIVRDQCQGRILEKKGQRTQRSTHTEVMKKEPYQTKKAESF